MMVYFLGLVLVDFFDPLTTQDPTSGASEIGTAE